VIDEEAKGDSAKHVFISGQTTHITIEEEHPGGEELNSDSPIEDDDFDMDVQPLPTAKHGKGTIISFVSCSLSVISGLTLPCGCQLGSCPGKLLFAIFHSCFVIRYVVSQCGDHGELTC